LSLLSTGKAEYVKEVNLILQDMKIRLIPSQPMHFHPWKAAMKTRVKQNPSLDSRGMGRDRLLRRQGTDNFLPSDPRYLLWPLITQ
jgi:hypothetical protein